MDSSDIFDTASLEGEEEYEEELSAAEVSVCFIWTWKPSKCWMMKDGDGQGWIVIATVQGSGQAGGGLDQWEEFSRVAPP